MSNTRARGIHIQMNAKHDEVMLGIQDILKNGRTESQISEVKWGTCRIFRKKWQHTWQVKFCWATPNTLRHKEYGKRVNKLLVRILLSKPKVIDGAEALFPNQILATKPLRKK